jgi:hypothetical protein
MTNLPQMTVEAEALACAKTRVTEIHESNASLGFGDYSWFTQEAGHAVLRNALKQHAMVHPFNMAEVKSYARAGWGDAKLALGELIAEFAGRGELPPPQLLDYTIEMMHPHLSHPPGRQKADNIMRNIAITIIIWEIADRFDLRPTRNRQARAPARRRSACSIVAQALAEELPGGLVKPGERAVESIWEQFGRLVVGGASLKGILSVPNNPP